MHRLAASSQSEREKWSREYFLRLRHSATLGRVALTRWR